MRICLFADTFGYSLTLERRLTAPLVVGNNGRKLSTTAFQLTGSCTWAVTNTYGRAFINSARAILIASEGGPHESCDRDV